MSRERAEARCYGQHDLFDSPKPQHHRLARALCLGEDGTDPCPFINSCRASVADLQTGIHQYGVRGTWAGQVHGRYTKETA